MRSAQRLTVLHYIRRFADSCAAGAMSDSQLLELFQLRQDEVAFAALLARHGPMILGVCRRLLHHPQDAEDAFQATFLVLLRGAGAIAKRDSLGSWLYRVAYRIALRAKARTNRYQPCDAPDELPDTGREGPADLLVRRELCAALDEEINRLPEKYRGPLVLCYLEGTPREEAARRLGWSLGTLRRRLEHGRELLRHRLERRGVALSAGLAAAGLGASIAPAAVPAGLAATTLKAAVLVAAGDSLAAATISAQAAALSKGLLHAFWLTKVKTVTTVLVAVAVLGAGIGRLAYHAQGEAQAPANKPQAVADNPGAEIYPSKRSKKDFSPAAQVAPGAEDDKPKTVSVSILGSDGRPLADADVAAIGRTMSKQRIRREGGASEVLGKGKTDGDGKFSFTLPGSASEHFWNVFVVARGDKHGLGSKDIDLAPAPSFVELRLSPERVRRGRLLTLQGLPANGVVIRVAQVRSQSQETGRFCVRDTFLAEDMTIWPRAVVTDDQGRFILRGIGPEDVPSIAVADARFARQEFEVKPKSTNHSEEVALALPPGRVVEGRVTYKDTGKPAARARVFVQARENNLFLPGNAEPVECQTDADGRFRATAQVGNYVSVAAYPPDGEPYLLVRKGMEWPKTGQVKQDVQLALFRGVMVRGKVVERASGKPVAGASFEFRWRRSQNPYYRAEVGAREDYPVSDADGKFQIVVPPRPRPSAGQGGHRRLSPRRDHRT
jgi:RNA polymerase sigma factor (sigma-70 family)